MPTDPNRKADIEIKWEEVIQSVGALVNAFSEWFSSFVGDLNEQFDPIVKELQRLEIEKLDRDQDKKGVDGD